MNEDGNKPAPDSIQEQVSPYAVAIPVRPHEAVPLPPPPSGSADQGQISPHPVAIPVKADEAAPRPPRPSGPRGGRGRRTADADLYSLKLQQREQFRRTHLGLTLQ